MHKCVEFWDLNDLHTQLLWNQLIVFIGSAAGYVYFTGSREMFPDELDHLLDLVREELREADHGVGVDRN